MTLCDYAGYIDMHANLEGDMKKNKEMEGRKLLEIHDVVRKENERILY